MWKGTFYKIIVTMDKQPLSYDSLLLFHELIQQFNSTLDIKELLPVVFEKVISLLHAEAGSIWLLDESQKKIVCEVAKGEVGEQIQGRALNIGKGIAGEVAHTKTPLMIEDAQKDSRFYKRFDEKTGFETRSMLCTPVLVKGKLLGVIQVINKINKDDRFSSNDLNLLTGLADIAGTAINNARLYYTEKKVDKLKVLLEISRKISSTLDLDAILKTITDTGSLVVPFERCSIALLYKGRLKISAITGAEKIAGESEITERIRDILLSAVDSNKSIYISKEDRKTGQIKEYLSETGMESMYIAPLADEQGILGAMLMESRQPDFLGSEKRDMADILANQAVTAIRNAMLYQEIPLSGLWGLFRKKKMVVSKLKFLTGIIIASAVLFVKYPNYITGDCTIISREGNNIEARILISESYIAQLSEGIPVTIKISAYPGKKLYSKIEYIGPVVDENGFITIGTSIKDVASVIKQGMHGKAYVNVGKTNLWKNLIMKLR